MLVNGVQLYYEECGHGTPILGLHGAGSSAVFWEDAAERLSQLGRAIIYDRRGSNRSERPDPYEATSVREHADDALALLQALDAEPAILVGRSYGGTVALDLALRCPESVLGLALLEAGPMGFSLEYDLWFDVDQNAYLRYVRAAQAGTRPNSRDNASPVRIGLPDDQGFPFSGTLIGDPSALTASRRRRFGRSGRR